MFLETPIQINGKTVDAITLVTTIFSGHSGEEEPRSATAKIIPMEINEQGDRVPMDEATSYLVLTLDANTPSELLPYIGMIQEGIKGVIRTVANYPV